MFECRIKENEYPEEGEIVVARTTSTDGDILNMKLTEYGDIPGLVLSSELSKKRIRSMHQITKVGNAEVCQVLKVDRARGYIDLSLRSVGEREKRMCLENAGKNKLAYQIMLKAARLAGVPVKRIYEEVGYERARKHGTLYSYLACAKDDPELLAGDEKYGKYFAQVLEEQFKPSSFKVRIDLDVTDAIGGVASIKAAFRQASSLDGTLEIVLLRSPTYSITKIGDSKNESFDVVNRASELVKEYIEKHGGTFSVASPAKVYGEKNKHMLLDESRNGGQAEDSDDSDDSEESSE